MKEETMMKKMIAQALDSIIFRIFMGILIVILPINILIIFSSQMLYDSMSQQSYLKSEHALTLYVEQFDNQLNNVTRFLFDETATVDYLSLVRPNTSTPEQQYNYVKSQTRYRNKLSELIRNNQFIDGSFSYFENRSISIINANNSDDGEKMIAYSLEHIEKINDDGRKNFAIYWEPITIDSKNYVLYLNKKLNSYYGAWVDLDKLLSKIIPLNQGDDFYHVLRNDAGEVIANHHQLSPNLSSYQMISVGSKQSPIELVELMTRNRLLDTIPDIARIIQIFSFACLFAIPVIAIIINKQVIKPVQMLLRAIHEINQGHMDYRIDEYHTANEFHDINASFNAMMNQIQTLKIDIYESEISKQRVRLDYLSQQIQPHFILNTLNIIYSYEAHEYAQIQQMIVNLTRYFRYIVRMNATYVSMAQELDHVMIYMDIQHVRYPNSFEFNIECDASLRRCLIPPLIIQNFVENAFKYAFEIDAGFSISVSVKAHGMDSVLITIEDNGRGFNDKVLEALKNYRQGGILQAELGVGIQNSIERLELLYNNMSQIYFGNRINKGACIKIIIPKHDVDVEEEEDV